MLAEGPLHPDLVKQQLDRCRAVFYYRDDQLSSHGRALVLSEFTKALVAIPAWAAEQSFDEWRQRGTRAPLVGDILNRARLYVEDARARLRHEDEPAFRAMTAEEQAAREAAQDCIPEEVRERRAKLVENLTAGSYLAPEEPIRERRIEPWEPQPETDDQVAQRVRTQHLMRHGSEMVDEPTAEQIDAYRRRERIPRRPA